MKKSNYFKSKEGGFVLAFLATILAFALIVFGLQIGNSVLYILGFVVILGAMIYAPIRKFIIDKPKR